MQYLDVLKAFFDTVGGWVWGPVMLVFLVGTGVYLTLRLAFLQFTMLPFALKQRLRPIPKRATAAMIRVIFPILAH